MKVAIVGSRDLPSFDGVVRFVNALARKYPDAVVVSGGARGVDSYAELAAKNDGLRVVSFRPYKNNHPDNAGTFSITRHEADRGWEFVGDETYPSFRDAAMTRNGLIVAEADQVVAFWDGKSNGTRDSIRKAEALGKPVHIYS